MDCGPGVLSNLQRHFELEDLTGVLITHMHSDHFLDLIPLRYALTYGGIHRPEPVPLYLPPGGTDIWDRLTAVLDESNGKFSSCFSITEYPVQEEFDVGLLKVRATLLRHYVSNYGVEVRGEGSLAYTGDTGPCPQLQDLSRESDLFLCEATWLESEIPPEERGHLTVVEAGTVASHAETPRLMLTHMMPGIKSQDAVDGAGSTFEGEILVAEEGQTYRVGSP